MRSSANSGIGLSQREESQLAQPPQDAGGAWRRRHRRRELVSMAYLYWCSRSIKSRRFYFQFPAPCWKREAPQGWNAPRIIELNEAEIFRRKRGKIRHVVQIVDMSEGMRVVRRIDIG